MKGFRIILLLLSLSVVREAVSQDIFVEASGDKFRTITKSQKVGQLPGSYDSIIDIPPVTYYLEPARHTVKFATKPISPAKLKVVEPLEKLYSGYVKAGIGNYTSPYLEAYYNSQRSKTNSWGLDLMHHSALGSINDVGVNKYSDNHFGGFYKHFLRKHTIEGGLDYDRNNYYYYGFSTLDTLIPAAYRESEDTIHQTYNLIAFNSQLKSRYKDSSQLNHTIDLGYKYLSSRTGISEHNLLVSADMFKFMEKEEIGGMFSLDFNGAKTPFQHFINPLADSVANAPEFLTNNNAILKLNPYIHSRGKNWEVKAGLGIHANIMNSAKFHFYPDVHASYSLFNNVFVPYLSLSGQIQRNSYNTLRLENPFVLSNVDLMNTNQKIKFQAGVRGSISSTISFNLAASQEKLEGTPLFFNDTAYSYENKFGVIYDTLVMTTVSGQIAYQKLEKMKLYAKGEVFGFSKLDGEQAWYRPKWRFTVSGTYDLADKILVRTNIFVVGKRTAFSYREVEGVTPTEGKYIFDLKPYVDANLGLEYRYNKKLSLFLDVNNLTTVKYQQWDNYPVQSINVIGGLTYSF